MNPTERYIAEHEKVFSLQRKVLQCQKPRKLVSWSLAGLFLHHTKLIVRTLIAYPPELYLAWAHLKKTKSLRSLAKDQRALVIGNGPSQGYLTVEQLDNFISTGGETFCINYWSQNDRLSKHIPSWMIFSDPATFDQDFENPQVLVEYLKENPSIKLSVPAFMLQTIKSLDLPNTIYCFIDTELSVWKNINPLFPRGYLSMTLYKALAWAVHMGFSEIGVIGMDNTYPRNLYNDSINRLQNLETHSGAPDFLLDCSGMYHNVASRLSELTRLFLHLEYFPQKSIVNLDQYSLTDRFQKVSVHDFLERNAC